jgi:hypothetical protein
MTLIPLSVLLAVVLVALALPQAALLYKRRRHLRVVSCPITGAEGLVRTGRAPAGSHRHPIVACSEWPRHHGCRQGCTHEFNDEPAARPHTGKAHP